MVDNSSISNSSGKFVRKLAVIIVVVAILDQVLGFGLQSLFFAQKSGDDFKTHFALTEAEAPLLIFGSSRAYRHLSPEVLNDSLGMAALNLGRMGQSIFYHQILLESIGKRYTPGHIILDMDPNELFYNSTHIDRLSCFLPYFWSDSSVRAHLPELRGQKEYVKSVSRLYRFNSTLIYSLRNKVVDESEEFYANRGFMPYTSSMSQADYNVKLNSTLKFDALNKAPIDDKKEAAFVGFIKYCEQHHIKLAVVVSPILYHLQNGSSYNRIKEICKANNVTLLDHEHDKNFQQYRKFYDLNHLSKKSAIEYSASIATELSEIW